MPVAEQTVVEMPVDVAAPSAVLIPQDTVKVEQASVSWMTAVETEVAVEKFVASLEGTEHPAAESEPVVVVRDSAVVEDAVEDEAAAAGSPADDTNFVDHNSAA